MQTILPQFTSAAADLMAISLLLSGLAMVIVILGAFVYVFSVKAAGTSFAVDTLLAALSFVLSKVWMASMLQVVALSSAVGGGAASAIGAVEMIGNKAEGATDLALILIGALMGAVSLSGSLIAWTRLDRVIQKPLKVRGRLASSLMVTATALAVIGYIAFTAQEGGAAQLIATPAGLIYWPLGCGLLLGALITLPICQERMADMIYFHNAFAGLAIGLEGFMLQSSALVVAGMLVGTARMIFALTMVKLSYAEADRKDGDAIQRTLGPI